MVEQQSKRVEETMKKMVNDLDSLYLRKMQANMHRCSARCCDNSDSSMEEAHACVQACSRPLLEAEQLVQNEFTSCQNRLQRCIMECNDSIKDRMGASPSESEVRKYQMEFDNCAVKCVDSHMKNLPTMMSRLTDILKKKQENSALYYPS